MPDKLAALYDGLVAQQFDVGEFGVFVEKMKDPAKRTALYNAAKTKFNLGTPEIFEQKVLTSQYLQAPTPAVVPQEPVREGPPVPPMGNRIEAARLEKQAAREQAKAEGQDAYNAVIGQVGNEIARFVREGGRGLTAGYTDFAGSVGTGMQYLGGITNFKPLEELGKETNVYWDRIGKNYEIPEDMSAGIVNDPKILAKPAWWAYNVGRMAPSLVAAMAPGAATAKGIQVFGTAYQWTPQLVTRLARLGGALAGGTVGGALEGTQTYQEILQSGKTTGDAEKGFMLMTLASGALNALSLDKIFRTMPAGVKGKITRYLANGTWEGLTEWGEEPAEGFIKTVYGDATMQDVVDQTIQGVNVIPPAMLLGMLGTGGAQGTVKAPPKETTVPVESTETPAEIPVTDKTAKPVPVTVSGEAATVPVGQAKRTIDDQIERLQELGYPEDAIVRMSGDERAKVIADQAGYEEPSPAPKEKKTPSTPAGPAHVEKQLAALGYPDYAIRNMPKGDKRRAVRGGITWEQAQQPPSAEQGRVFEPAEDMTAEAQTLGMIREAINPDKPNRLVFGNDLVALKSADQVRLENGEIQANVYGTWKTLSDEQIGKLIPSGVEAPPRITPEPEKKEPAPPAETVPEADNWYVHGSHTGDLTGVIELTKDAGVAKFYAGQKGKVYRVRPKEQAAILDLQSSDAPDMDAVVEKAVTDFNNGNLPFVGDIETATGKDRLEIQDSDISDIIRETFAPQNIVESAGAYDRTDWINWLSDKFNVDFVRLPNSGAVVLNDKMIDVRSPEKSAPPVVTPVETEAVEGTPPRVELQEIHPSIRNEQDAFVVQSGVLEMFQDKYVTKKEGNDKFRTIRYFPDGTDGENSVIIGYEQPGERGGASKIIASHMIASGITKPHLLFGLPESTAKTKQPGEIPEGAATSEPPYIPEGVEPPAQKSPQSPAELSLLGLRDAINQMFKDNRRKGRAQKVRDFETAAAKAGYKVERGKGRVSLLTMAGDTIKRQPIPGEKPSDMKVDATLLEELHPTTRANIERIVQHLGDAINVPGLTKEQIKAAVADVEKDNGKEASNRAQMLLDTVQIAFEEGYIPILTNYGIKGAKMEATAVSVEDVLKEGEALPPDDDLPFLKKPQRKNESLFTGADKPQAQLPAGKNIVPDYDPTTDTTPASQGNLFNEFKGGDKDQLDIFGRIAKLKHHAKIIAGRENAAAPAEEGQAPRDAGLSDAAARAVQRRGAQKAVAYLKGRLRHIDQALPDTAVQAVEKLTTDEQNIVDLADKLFRRQVVFVKADPKHTDFLGLNAGNTIFINRDVPAETHPFFILGHEFTHQLKQDAHHLYRQLVDWSLSADPGAYQRFYDYRMAHWNPQTQSEAEQVSSEEEFVADIVGERFGDVEFWKNIYDMQAPEDRDLGKPGYHGGKPTVPIRNILEHLKSFLDRMLRKFKLGRYFKASGHFQHSIGSVHGMVDQIMAKYAQARRDAPGMFPRGLGELKAVKRGQSLDTKEEWQMTRQEFIEARDITKKMAGRPSPIGKGEYAGEHEAPGFEDGSPGYDLTANGTYPEDVYSYEGLRFYGDGGDHAAMDAESMSQIKRMRNHPDALVKIYRAVPRDLKKPGIYSGDWVTISRAYAKEHGKSNLNGKYKIISKLVHPRDIYTDGNSIHEWGYDAQGMMPSAEMPHRYLRSHQKRTQFIKLAEEHKNIIEKAIAEGKAIPTNVLDEYQNKEISFLKDPRRTQMLDIYEQAVQKKKPGLFQRMKSRRTAERHITADLLAPISTQMKNIHIDLFRKIRGHEFRFRQHIKADHTAVKPLLEAIAKMSKDDQVIMDLAMKNADGPTIKRLAYKYSFFPQLGRARKTLNAIFDRAKEVGFKVEFREDYFPRMLKDKTGFLNYLYGTDAWGTIREAFKEKELELKRSLTESEKAELANNVIRGFGGSTLTLTEPGSLKERVIDLVDADLNEFFRDSSSSLLAYLVRVNEAIEARRFFGKHLTTNPNADQTEILAEEPDMADLNDSIGAYVTQLIDEEKITPAQENYVTALLRARFGYRPTYGPVATLKNIGYITAMGSGFTSTVTQLGDFAWSFYNAGMTQTFKSAVDVFSQKQTITRKDIGIEHVAEEFADFSALSKTLDKIFRYTGLFHLDALGKETLLNATLAKMQKQARNNAINPRYRKRIEEVFGDETADVIEDLQSGEITENVKLLAFNTLLDYQPVALSEMPRRYLESPNGRIFYMLKTFTIKQMDAFRREGIRQIRHGETTAEKIQGYRNLAKLGALFLLCNATADVIKDWMTGRDPELEEYIVDNLLRLVGLSRYMTWYARREGIANSIWKLARPPLDVIELPARDVDDVYKLVEKGEWDSSAIRNLQTWKIIPFFGKHYYWWFGGGREEPKPARSRRSSRRTTRRTTRTTTR